MRDAIAADFSEIQRIHAESGLDYQLPELESPLFFVRKVFCDRQGNILGACLLRLTAEAYLFLDPETGARKKMEIMQELQPAVLEAAWSKGIDEVECRIPETVEHRFMKRLLQLGWSRDRSDWWPWSRKTR